MSNLNLMTPEERAVHEAAERAEYERRMAASPAEQRRLLKEQMAELDRQEARAVLGARNLTPKQRLLDIDALNADSTQWHYRWLNTANEAKMATRVADGYEVVPESEGGRRLGQFVLGRCSKRIHEDRVRHQDQMTAEQLANNGSELEAALDDAQREIRDRGIKGRPLNHKRIIKRQESED